MSACIFLIAIAVCIFTSQAAQPGSGQEQYLYGCVPPIFSPVTGQPIEPLFCELESWLAASAPKCDPACPSVLTNLSSEDTRILRKNRKSRDTAHAEKCAISAASVPCEDESEQMIRNLREDPMLPEPYCSAIDRLESLIANGHPDLRVNQRGTLARPWLLRNIYRMVICGRSFRKIIGDCEGGLPSKKYIGSRFSKAVSALNRCKIFPFVNFRRHEYSRMLLTAANPVDSFIPPEAFLHM